MAKPPDTIITIKTVADTSGADKTAQASEGLLRFDDETVFGPTSAVTNRRAAVVGCSVAVNYTIVG